MDKSQREALAELGSSTDGLIQLASWQLALAREIKTKITALGGLGATEVGRKPASGRRKHSKQ